jgi:hypothetical protein
MEGREQDPAYQRQRDAAYEYFGLELSAAVGGRVVTIDDLVIAIHEKFRELEDRITRGI